MRSVDPCGTTKSIFALGFTAASATASFSFLANAGTHVKGGAPAAGGSRQPPYFISWVAGCDSLKFVWAEIIVANNGKEKMEYTIRQGRGINVSLKHLRGEKMRLCLLSLLKLQHIAAQTLCLPACIRGRRSH